MPSKFARSGRNAFFPGMNPLRTGMIHPQNCPVARPMASRHTVAGQNSCSIWATTRRVRQEPDGDHTDALPTATASRILGLPYHLTPCRGELPGHQQDSRPSRRLPRRARTRLIRSPEVPGAVDRNDGLPDAATTETGVQVRWFIQDPDAAAIRARLNTREIEGCRTRKYSAKVVDSSPQRDPKKTKKPFFVWYTRRACTSRPAKRQVHGHGGRAGRQGRGVKRSRHEADGRQYRHGRQKLQDMGKLDNTMSCSTPTNGAEEVPFPDGGVTRSRARR